MKNMTRRTHLHMTFEPLNFVRGQTAVRELFCHLFHPILIRTRRNASHVSHVFSFLIFPSYLSSRMMTWNSCPMSTPRRLSNNEISANPMKTTNIGPIPPIQSTSSCFIFSSPLHDIRSRKLPSTLLPKCENSLSCL